MCRDARRLPAASRLGSGNPAGGRLDFFGRGADPRDTSRWRTERGPLSVTGTKFFSWQARHGGGGAIDLVMHLGGWDARRAIGWLWRQLGGHLAVANPSADNQSDADPASDTRSTSSPASSSGRGAPRLARDDRQPTRCRPHHELHLPAASPTNLPRVRRYLTERRGLSATILAALIDEGKVYADRAATRSSSWWPENLIVP